MSKRYFLIFILLSIIFPSCFNVKSASTRSANNLFETFFVGEEGTQYFIKPLSFVNANKEKLHIDFTFRYKNKVDGFASAKMTIESEKPIKKIKKILISNTKKTIPLSEIEFMFIKREKNKFNSRFSAVTEIRNLEELFSSNSWFLEIELEEKVVKFQPQKQTKKSIYKLDQSIFIVF